MENTEQKSNVRILTFDELREFLDEHPEIIEEHLRKKEMQDMKVRFGLPTNAILIAGNDRSFREEFIASMALTGDDWKPEMLVVAPKFPTLDIVEEMRKLHDEMMEPLKVEIPVRAKDMFISKMSKKDKKFFVPDRILFKRKRK